ncbi:MAG TPA: CPBP family intramembrane glutamic endopeptidase [Candidatus Saccharimonadales bacterium]|nr:CPBP family intramembrane glutamic endopeptidase [Candidatus Saccharimonadales bacterium]
MAKATSEQPPILQTSLQSSQLVRSVQAVVFVGIWMAIGWLFHLDANSYLVAGVPLVIMFQVLARKKPLVTLWIRNAERFRLNSLGIILGLGLAVLPTVRMIQTFQLTSWPSHAPEILWYVCCIVGAFGAAFAFCHFIKQTWKELGFCMLTAGVIGSGTMLLGAITRYVMLHKPIVVNGAMAVMGVQSFLLYVPVCFVLEEVVFRGAIDSHVFQPGDKGQWWTAFFVSTLWGWWHLPITGANGISRLIALIVVLPCIHIAVGVFLSLSWRRSGNLAVSATVHAFIDAVRNMLM